MWWDVFDKQGNKVGEIRERDSDPGGLGCFFNSILVLLIGLGALIIWPIMLFSQDASGIGFIQMIVIIATLVVHGKKIREKDCCSFWGTWISLVLSSTIVSSLASWLVSGLSITALLAGLFINFLLSIGSSLIAAFIIAYLRRDS